MGGAGGYDGGNEAGCKITRGQDVGLPKAAAGNDLNNDVGASIITVHGTC